MLCGTYKPLISFRSRPLWLNYGKTFTVFLVFQESSSHWSSLSSEGKFLSWRKWALSGWPHPLIHRAQGITEDIKEVNQILWPSQSQDSNFREILGVLVLLLWKMTQHILTSDWSESRIQQCCGKSLMLDEFYRGNQSLKDDLRPAPGGAVGIHGAVPAISCRILWVFTHHQKSWQIFFHFCFEPWLIAFLRYHETLPHLPVHVV